MKNITRILLFVILLSLFASSTLAIGLSPLKKQVNFEPNLKKSIKLTVINNEGKDFNVKIDARGDLAPYINIKDEVIAISKAEKMKTFTYELNLPTEFDTPGNYEGEIVVLEMPNEEEGGNVKAVVAVGSKIYVRVFYEGLLADAQIFIDSKDDNTIDFSIPVLNYGTIDINKAKAEIKIFKSNESIKNMTTNEISIESAKQGRLVASWSANASAGSYIAKIIVDYDGNNITLEKEFNVGKDLIGVNRIEVRDFILGDIAKFDIFLENKMNQELEDVYGEIIILDESDQQKTNFKTATVDISPGGEESIQAYWDTKEVSVGKYYMNLIVHYMGRVTEKIVELDVNIDSIKTSLPPTGQVVAQRSPLGGTTQKVVFIIVIILINAAWIIYIKKFRKKNN